MKKISLFLLFSSLCMATYAASTSAIATVTVSDINRNDDNTYEIFAFTNTQGSTATTTTAFEFVTKGTYTTDDITGFSLYRNTTNSLEGATYIGSVVATPAGLQVIKYDPLVMPDSTTLYYMIYANVAKTAKSGHTITVSEISNTANAPFTFTGSDPVYIKGSAAPFKTMRLSDLGQLQFDPAHPFDSYMLGAGIGYTSIYGDLEHSVKKPVAMLEFSRHITADIVVGINYQHGAVSSYTAANNWTTGLNETNIFNAINLNARVNFSQFMKDQKSGFSKTLAKCYAGTGIGIIDNDLVNITRKFKESDTKDINADIKTNTVAAVLPINLGINIDLKKILDFRGAQFNINYKMTYSFNDYVDGYSFSKANTRNNYNDIYSIFSIGFSFYLGHIVDSE